MRNQWPVLVILALLLTGCGGDSFSGDIAADDQAGEAQSRESAVIRRTMKAGIRQATDGSARKACRYITRAGHERMVGAYSRSYPDRDLRSCEQIVRFERKNDPSSVQDARESTIPRITVRRSRATAVVAGPKYGGYGMSYRFYLKKVGSTWKVDDSNILPAGQ
jgi:hypothetical protein